jgi:hypothetical protein
VTTEITIEHSDELPELAKALIAVQAEVPAIPKESDNPFFKSKYADFADVKAVADPIVTKHGLAVTQWPSHNERGDTLVTMLLHSSGQFVKAEMQLHLVKQDAQSHGSALTYAKRYSYMAALGLVADEDDDGNKASQPSNQRSGGKTKAQPSARQSRSSTPRTADPETGEIPEPPNVQSAIEKLDQDGRKQLQEKMTAAHYPPIDKLPTAAARQVIKWAEEIGKGAPFDGATP